MLHRAAVAAKLGEADAKRELAAWRAKHPELAEAYGVGDPAAVAVAPAMSMTGVSELG